MKSFKNWREKFNEYSARDMPSSRAQLALDMKNEILATPVRSAKLLYFIFQAMVELGEERDPVMNRLRIAIAKHLQDPKANVSEEEREDGMRMLTGWWSKLAQAGRGLRGSTEPVEPVGTEPTEMA